MEKCRLCLSTLSVFTSVNEVHDGLPLSVVIMIVCPIRVDTKDSLPKVVCEDCLEAVLSAFRLRDASIKNDRYLRRAVDCEVVVKQEIEYKENNFVSVGYKQENTSEDEFTQCVSPSSSPRTSGFLSGTHVHISKKPDTKTKSLVWDFFGRLCNESGQNVDNNHNYCSLCFADNIIKKYNSGNSTTTLMKHLDTAHNIYQDQNTIPEGSSGDFIERLKCDLCPETFAGKNEIIFHMTVDHCSAENFRIECEESNKPLILSYFGRLLYSDKTVVPEASIYSFCKVCLEKDQKLSYRSISSHRKTLSDHLQLQHGIKVKGTSMDFVSREPGQTRNEISINAFGFGVDCHKACASRSLAWRYFGNLVDSDSNPIRSESEYIFCKTCVAENWTEKRKFKRNGSSTSTLLSHLFVKHGIDESSKAKNSVEASPSIKSVNHQELTEIKIEEIFRNINFNTAGVGVYCNRSVRSISKAWKYFGSLVDKNRDQDNELDPHHFYCKICVENGIYTKFQQTTGTSSLLRHVKLLHSNEFETGDGKLRLTSKKGQNCEFCDGSFKSFTELRTHIRRNHPTEAEPARNFMCHICSKSFSLNYILTKHMKIHEGNVYRCTLCPAKFSLALRLKRHMNVHDPSHFKRFKCDHCGKGFSEKRVLQNHVEGSHSSRPRERKHQCVHCEARFLKPESLNLHLMKHTGEKPHACNYCDNTYIQKGDLVRHLKKMHVGDNIYKCTIEGCTKAFGYQVELREHYRVHYENEDAENIVEVNDDAQ